MDISQDRFFRAAADLKLPADQAKALWDSLENASADPKPSPVSKLLYYFGALLVISAMSWLMTISWEWFGGGGIFLIALAYALLFLWLGTKLWQKKDLRTPAGLLITMAVCMTPLAIFGLQTYFGAFPSDDLQHYPQFYDLIAGRWVVMELGTILAGLAALKFFSFPFLTAPIFFSAWFLSMDSISWLTGSEASWEQKEWISLLFGIAVLLISYFIDRKKHRDYAFWGYLFGTLIFWGSLGGLAFGNGEFALALYLLVNISMMLFSILLKRKVFMIFGALGAFAYFSHLAYTVFQDSILFPFVLSFIGLVIICLGVLYQRNEAAIESKVREMIPPGIRNFFS